MIGSVRETVREFNGRIIGFIDTLPSGDKEVRDYSGRLLGRYDKKNNLVRDFSGRILYRGDQSSMLLNRK